MKEYKYNRYNIRLNDELDSYLKSISSQVGVSPVNYIRILITKDMNMRGDINESIISQK